MTDLDIPAHLRRARLELEGVPGYQLLQDWSWLPTVHRWALRFRLCHAVHDSSPIAGETDWVLTVSSGYPWGGITVYPAKENGITATFPHQSLNEEGETILPHRTGNLCLGIMTQDWQIRHGLSEPHTVEERLRWHVERTNEWIERARAGTLFRSGEEWEPPARAHEDLNMQILFGEQAAACGDKAERRGLVELLFPDPAKLLLFADRFISLNEPAFSAASQLGVGLAVGQAAWGTTVNTSKLALTGVWIQLTEAPVFPAWRLPMTWGELRDFYQAKEHASLDAHITEVVQRAGRNAERVAYLLLGYPVPTKIGDSQFRLQWEACSLPKASAGGRLPSDEQRLVWANVHDQRALMRQIRGQLSPELGQKTLMLIGAGALGSSVAELLVRGGVNQLDIADGETLQLGNLVRHTLTVSDLGINKAVAVAARLNASSLDARVRAFPENLSSQRLSVFMEREPDIVLDTTGSDQVLSDLAGWHRPTLFFSASLGLYARRIYLFAARQEQFPVDVFHSQMQPWLKRDREETKGLPLPATEGIGCWSPVFPARLDDISLLASAAVKWIEECVALPLLAPQLTVFEREGKAGCFIGVRRLQ